MTNVPLGPGGWYYQLGYRICVSGLGQGVAKTKLQSAFGDFGHIIKIETPAGAKGVAYISFQDKRDAQDAVKAMDGECVDGHRVRVSLAEDKPPPGGREKGPRESPVLTTTNSEREDLRTTAVAPAVAAPCSERSRSRSPRSPRSGSRGHTQRRKSSRRRGRSGSRSRA